MDFRLSRDILLRIIEHKVKFDILFLLEIGEGSTIWFETIYLLRVLLIRQRVYQRFEFSTFNFSNHPPWSLIWKINESEMTHLLLTRALLHQEPLLDIDFVFRAFYSWYGLAFIFLIPHVLSDIYEIQDVEGWYICRRCASMTVITVVNF